MKVYSYKGFRFYKGTNPCYGNYYIIGNRKDGQIAPSDQMVPRTIAQCKSAINSWLKVPKTD